MIIVTQNAEVILIENFTWMHVEYHLVNMSHFEVLYIDGLVQERRNSSA